MTQLYVAIYEDDLVEVLGVYPTQEAAKAALVAHLDDLDLDEDDWEDNYPRGDAILVMLEDGRKISVHDAPSFLEADAEEFSGG